MNVDVRKAIWAELSNVKFKSYCLGIQITKFQIRDRNMNIFLAIASSGSIAAWTIWSDFPMVWGGIIAFSQLLTVVKPYLQFNRHVKELNPKCLEIAILFNKVERLWNDVQLNRVNESGAADQLNDIKDAKTKILHFSDDASWEVSEKVEKKANEKTISFLSNNYNVVF